MNETIDFQSSINYASTKLDAVNDEFTKSQQQWKTIDRAVSNTLTDQERLQNQIKCKKLAIHNATCELLGFDIEKCLTIKNIHEDLSLEQL